MNQSKKEKNGNKNQMKTKRGQELCSLVKYYVKKRRKEEFL